MKIALILSLLFFVWLAVLSKVRFKTRSGAGKAFPTDTRESAFSKALAELVATAGGIYVSLLLLFSFLDMAVPGKITLAGIQVDALAGISLAIALLQPIIAGLIKKVVL